MKRRICIFVGTLLVTLGGVLLYLHDPIGICAIVVGVIFALFGDDQYIFGS